MFIIVFPLDICFWRALGELNMDGESEIRSVEDLEAKLADVMLPFDEIVPVAAKEWLEKVATSHGTSREMFLLSALTSTSALIGKSTLQVFSTYGEKGNLFTVVIAPSGSGKTPACHLGCIDPIVEHLEPKIEKSIVMDDASSNGLFNHFVSGDTVPVLCIDEAHSFLMKITSLSKSAQANLTLERLCKCFDGDCWYVLKGNKGKRAGIPSARASLLAFTTPKQFLQTVWPKMLSAENGFAERVLLFYQRKEEKDLEVMAQHSGALEDFPIQSLDGVLEQIYAEHNNNPPVKYTLTATAREAFFKFAKPQDHLPNSQGAVIDVEANVNNSKRNKHVLRLALSMHVLYDRLKKALELQTGPTSHIIGLETLNMAIVMVQSLEIYKGMSRMVSDTVYMLLVVSGFHS